MKTDSVRVFGESRVPAELPPALRRIFERKKLFLKFGYNLDREREVILEQVSPLRGKILEAGTGKGHFASALAKRGLTFTSFDISKEERDLAKLYLKFQLLDGFADLRVENGEHLSFKDECYDMVFSINTLHHFTQPHKVLGELIRVLKPGGKMILSDFTAKGFKSMDQIHALEGNVHDRGTVTIPGFATYLRKQKFLVRKSATLFHQTIITEKPQ
ncbi:MAG: class I SAM-dependent methyltransferase [Candidatus Omnitrophota bacterium]|jgi:ubiquinone/menaquinone biosynthesis C-methylase UbiE